MGCWRWFNGVLKEAGVKVTPENQDKIEAVIHQHVGEHAQYQQCGVEWTEKGKRVKLDPKEKKKLVDAVKDALK